MLTCDFTFCDRVEPRFSESIADGNKNRSTSAGAAACTVRSGSGIEELGGLSFLSLVQRMVKVRRACARHEAHLERNAG